MPNIAFFRRKANICLHLSLLSSDLEIARRLMAMAEEYTAKADSVASDRDNREGALGVGERRAVGGS